MKKIVYKSQAIQAVILLAAAVLLLSLWPFRIWNETITESIPQNTGAMTDVINDEYTILQSFVAQYDHMDAISLYLGDGTEGESFFVRLLNEGQTIIAEEEVEIKPEQLPGYCEVMIDVDMEVGKMYHLIVQGNQSAVFLGCENVSLAEMPYAGAMYYNSSTVEGVNLVAEYHYSVPLRKGKVFLFGGLLALTAIILIGAVRLFYRNREDKLITVERTLKTLLNPIVAAGTVGALIAVCMGACGNYLLDNSFFFLSVLLLSAILFYGINHNRDGQEPVITLEYIKGHFPDLLQSVFIAGAVSGCCEYMAGLYDIHHKMAVRKEMLYFALAIIVMFKWKEIFNLYNLIYLIAAGIAGCFYYQNQVELLAGQAIKEAEIPWNIQVIRHTTLIGILLGLILIRTVIGLAKRKLARPKISYAGLILLFFASVILFRNGRWWTVAMAAGFGLLYLTYGMWEHKDRLLVNVCRGIILQFMLTTGYALFHRPYLTFRTARYTHIFHTVTITATYLTIVECAAIVILLSKLSKSRKLKDFWKEAVLFGVVSSYMLFTMSRTAFFAVGVTLLFAVIVMAAGRKKEKLKSIGSSLGVMALSVVVCLPVTFTMQRTIPVLVSDPYVYEIESYVDEALRGRKLDSAEFMRVGRFIDVFAEKIFSIPEGTFDIYGEIAEYERTHINGIEISELEMMGENGEAEDFNGEVSGVEDSGETSLTETALEGTDSEVTDPRDEDPQKEDYTNGRIDIFRSYIEQLNMTGHEEMGAILKDGAVATHAHNIYLQAAYDHGIPVGILFVLVGVGTFIVSLLYYNRKKDKITYAAMPVVVTVAVAVAGMVEWIFHLCNPCGFVLMLVITPLLFKDEK
ncbi:hypothetical protein C819_03073 [Lachnospiraceae bacterium 10-1]|nr:hypothetical protein C819_03073 [Lachnospiraceae bacterium 10-1]